LLERALLAVGVGVGVGGPISQYFPEKDPVQKH